MRLRANLTIIKSRLVNLDKILSYLFKQNVLDEILIYYSNTNAYYDEGIEENEFKTFKAKNVIFKEVPNIGSYRKYFFLLLDNKDFLNIVMDDDYIPEVQINQLIKMYNNYKCIIGGEGYLLSTDKFKIDKYTIIQRNDILNYPDYYHLPIGRGMILYSEDSIPFAARNFHFANIYASNCDDIWFKWFTFLNQNKVFLLSHALKNTGKQLATKINLSKNNLKNSNDKAIENLENFFKLNFYGFNLFNFQKSNNWKFTFEDTPIYYPFDIKGSSYDIQSFFK